jgi:hypothetical protein
MSLFLVGKPRQKTTEYSFLTTVLIDCTFLFQAKLGFLVREEFGAKLQLQSCYNQP